MSAPNESGPTTPRTAGEMVAMARAFLDRKGVESARLESELLVSHALSMTRLQLFMALDRPIAKAEIDAARDLLVRRGRREPCAYILGTREFYGRPFQVGKGVLIPRPETEHLIDRAREIVRERAAEGSPPTLAADLGTGSGALAVTLALEVAALAKARGPEANVEWGFEVDAVDVSAPALAFARANAAALGAERVAFLEGDGFATLHARVRERGRAYDLVVSNPPYIPREQRSTLAPEVRDHEPESALFAPNGDPDHFARRFLEERARLVVPGGTILIELGHDQAPRLRALTTRAGADVRFRKDYAGIERVLEIRVESPPR